MTSRRAHRRYYDRVLNSHPADDTPFKKPAKYPKKPEYLSKPFRRYQYYLTLRYGSILAMARAEHLHSTINREGFVRRMLTPAADRKPVAKPAVSAKYQAYLKEVLPRSRYLAYTIPEGWITWEAEEQLNAGKPATHPLVIYKGIGSELVLDAIFADPEVSAVYTKLAEELRQRVAVYAGTSNPSKALRELELRSHTPMVIVPPMPEHTTGELVAFQKLMVAKVNKALGLPYGLGVPLKEKSDEP